MKGEITTSAYYNNRNHGESLRPQATTILAVVRNGQVAMAGDGQVTFGDTILKTGARKIRTLYNDEVLAGFAGAVADALTLFEKFESQLEQYHGNLRKAAVELTKEWRTDKFLRRLEAQLLVADKDQVLILSGEGDVVEPDESVASIGSGSTYALAAAKALIRNTEMTAPEIAEKALMIAGEMCIYTNTNITLKVAPPTDDNDEDEGEEDKLDGSSQDGGSLT